MLTVFSLRAGRGDYYLADLAAELSFVRAPDPGGAGLVPGQPGRWIGRGAERLGLAGGVAGAPLAAVLAGRHPGSGRPLGSSRPVAVSAFDLTFAAPKSVSVLLALAPPEVGAAVLAAHEAAAASAFSYVEERAIAVRRGEGGDRTLLPVTGVAAAAFTHGLSRASDPHLHTHVVVANRAQGTDGRWSALDSRGLFAHARAAGALYRAHLRSGLSERLGVDWVRTGGGRSEVAGIPALAIGAFSSRRADIEIEVARRGLRSGSARRVAWATTRDEKAQDPAAAPRRWRSRGEALGLAGPELASVWGRALPAEAGIDEQSVRRRPRRLAGRSAASGGDRDLGGGPRPGRRPGGHRGLGRLLAGRAGFCGRRGRAHAGRPCRSSSRATWSAPSARGRRRRRARTCGDPRRGPWPPTGSAGA